ncbi:MAG: hypothetical protein LBV54_04210, partial [Puniceicoccales bacterium]|nr:hypothetical protein [Puniceicoccales bacterium]
MLLLAQTTLLEDLVPHVRELATIGFLSAALYLVAFLIFNKVNAAKMRRARLAKLRASGAHPPAPAAPVSLPGGTPISTTAVPLASPPPPALSASSCSSRPLTVRALLRNPVARRAAFVAGEIL